MIRRAAHAVRLTLSLGILLLTLAFPLPASLFVGENTAPQPPEQTCTLRGALTWLPNQYVDDKPDVGAKIFAFRDTDTPRKLSPDLKAPDPPNGVFVTRSGKNGEFEFTQIPCDSYDVLIVSGSAVRHHVRFDPAESAESLSNRARELQARALRNSPTPESIAMALDADALTGLANLREKILEPNFDPADFKSAWSNLLGSRKFTVESVTLSPRRTASLHHSFGSPNR